MPVYNEEEAIPSVLEEWDAALADSKIPYTMCVLNDGSKDTTLATLNELSLKYPRLKIVDKPNTGHGQTCITGYKLAIDSGADWIMQIDSDGQCDPKFFSKLVPYADKYKAIYGFRRTRDDGFMRFVISRFVSMFTLVATMEWINDANVPYRLIHESILRKIVDKVPKDFHLANIYVSVLCKKYTPIKWVGIHFRDRSGGSPSVKTFSFAKHGIKLFKQLRAASRGANA